MNRHSHTPSTISRASSSTTNKLWGSGTFTGKALEAFGETTLRGVKNLVIRRKLASLRSVFPHNNDTTIRNIEQVYDDVLELSRPHIYSNTTGQAALQLLMVQIGNRETYHLIKGLSKWPEIEIRTFLSQIMSTCMPDVTWDDDDITSNDIRRGLSNPRNEALQLAPMIYFIAELARCNPSARQATLEGGFLDMLLRIYVVFPTFYSSNAENPARPSALLDACESAIAVLSTDPLHADLVCNHPVHDLWLRGDQFIPGNVTRIPELLEDRCIAWRRTEAHFVKTRLMTIWSASRYSEENAEFQACIDIVEFSRQQYYTSDIVDLALLTIFKRIVAGGSVAQYLAVVIGRASCHDIADIAFGVMQLWLEYANTRGPSDSAFEHGGFCEKFDMLGNTVITLVASMPPNQIEALDETFYGHEKSLLFSKISSKQTSTIPHNNTALSNIVRFFTFAAQQSMTLQWGLLDAGALAVVLVAFVDGVPMLSDLLVAFRYPANDHRSKQKGISCISLSLIRTEASKLLDTIQTPAFRALLQTQIFAKRRRICLSLLDALLGSGGGVDDVYTELRNVFEEILYE